MSRIFWDTNLFIYLLEDDPQFSVPVQRLRAKMLSRGDHLLTSTITLGEILTKPMKAGDSARCSRYEHMLFSSSEILSFNVEAARQYAVIRAVAKVRPPDAIQLACAASAGVDLFVTNDNHLQGKHIPGIQFIALLDRVPI